MDDSVRNLLLKLIAAYFAVVLGAGNLVEGLGGGRPALDAAFVFAGGLFYLAVGVGFWKRRGWAYLVVSAWLLVSVLLGFFHFFLAFDAEDGAVLERAAIHLALVIVAIAVVSRWNTEKLFRPQAH